MKYDSKKNRWKTDRKVFVASDHHIGHKNIIEYDGRPFKDVQEMDEILVLNHNSVVSPNDVVIFAGDFALGSLEHASKIRDRLNGDIYITWGNHDGHARNLPWKSSSERMVIKVQGYPCMVISHYAQRTWLKQSKGYWHLYGHSHGSLPEDGSLSFDIGVNSHNYYPWSMEEIAKKMNTKQIKIVDHHKGDKE